MLATRHGRRLISTFRHTLAALCFSLTAGAALATDYNTNFTWQGGVSNTRHNLSMIGGANAAAFIMRPYRNEYTEVCVFCHTPHGANSQAGIASAPLWNRTHLNTSYQTYASDTLTGSTSAPGASSLTCLSCHDGKVAIDSIINMPGSGRYSAAAATSHQEAFLDAWGGTGQHHAIGHTSPGPTGALTGCMSCHNEEAPLSNATDFTAFYLSTDLRDDHPVGVQYPNNSDYNQGVLTSCGPSMKCFDRNGNSRADADEVRLYNSGQGYEVECASCHDPHGVMAPNGSQTMRMFLRVPNSPGGNNFVTVIEQEPDVWGTVYPPIVITETRAGPYGGDSSGLCLTCHVK